MAQSPGGANSRLVGQENDQFLFTLKVHYLIYTIPPLASVHIHLNPFFIFTPCFFAIHLTPLKSVTNYMYHML
jgi:hypothetical protein